MQFIPKYPCRGNVVFTEASLGFGFTTIISMDNFWVWWGDYLTSSPLLLCGFSSLEWVNSPATK